MCTSLHEYDCLWWPLHTYLVPVPPRSVFPLVTSSPDSKNLFLEILSKAAFSKLVLLIFFFLSFLGTRYRVVWGNLELLLVFLPLPSECLD